jgi:hypothetical protein
MSTKLLKINDYKMLAKMTKANRVEWSFLKASHSM